MELLEMAQEFLLIFLMNSFKTFCEFELPEAGQYAVSNVFLPRKENQRAYCVEVFETEIKKQGLQILGWRDVPVNSAVLGEIAKTTEPFVKQIFISKSDNKQTEFDFNLKLFAARKIAEHTIYDSKLSESKFFYLPSLSTKIIIFKGLLKPEHINEYYLDLFNSSSRHATGSGTPALFNQYISYMGFGTTF